MRLRHRLLRLLGVVSPSAAYPLPPRWAMSRKGRERWYPERPSVAAYGPGSVAAGGNIGSVVTGAPAAVWAADVAAGPVPRGALTRFSTGDPVHEHGGTSRGLCGPGGSAECYDRQPYVSEVERAAQRDH